MDQYDVKRLGLIFAVQAEIEGMKAENIERESNGLSLAYTMEEFTSKSDELYNLVHTHNENL